MTPYQENLVNNNLKMVYDITKCFKNRNNYEDIVSEGMVGLCNAAVKFEQLRGNNFCTFAYMHILGRCLNFINRDFAVKPSRKNGQIFEETDIINLSSELENLYSHKFQFIDRQLEEDLLFDTLRKRLTDIQYNVAKLLYVGYKKKEIIVELSLSQNQLSNIIQEIQQKLNELDIRSIKCNK